MLIYILVKIIEKIKIHYFCIISVQYSFKIGYTALPCSSDRVRNLCSFRGTTHIHRTAQRWTAASRNTSFRRPHKNINCTHYECRNAVCVSSYVCTWSSLLLSIECCDEPFSLRLLKVPCKMSTAVRKVKLSRINYYIQSHHILQYTSTSTLYWYPIIVRSTIV